MGARPRILIVEDRPDDAELVVAELRRHGLTVDWSRVDTLEGLDRGLSESPDLVVCDWALPGLDIRDVLSRIRAAIVDVPIIVISGVLEDRDAVSLLRRGVSDLLLKDRLGRLGPAVETAMAGRELAHMVRAADERERRTAQILNDLMEHAPAAIRVRTADGATIAANRKFEDLCIAGLPCAPDSAIAKAIEDREVRIGEETYLARAFPMSLSVGQQAEGLIMLDITRQKAIENALLATRAELQAQAEELRASNAELLQLDQMKSDFVSTVSHELRTPLTSIVGYAEMLQDAGFACEDPRQKQMIDMISRNSGRLLDLIENLLLLSRLDDGPATPSSGAVRDPVDVAELVESVIGVLAPVCDTAGVVVRAELADGLLPVPGDRPALERALLNLMSNAVKFSRRGGVVILRAHHHDHLILEVVDQGVGIDPESLARLGTRFFRSETARTAQIPGTGLGVAVVVAIVERHGGSVHFDSRAGVGTTVTVRLPTAR